MSKTSLQELANIDVRARQGLSHIGFISLGCWGKILGGKLPNEPLLENHGVYAVIRNESSNPVFLAAADAQRAGNVTTPFSLELLKARWVVGVHVLYFGAAGVRSDRPLRRRLNDMRRHCLGRTTKKGPHKGGEILWQVRGYRDFELMIMRTVKPLSPRVWECALNNRFLQLCGRLPFANSEP